MSYRAFKHLLGETSLERKCRFLLGAGILLLIAASFYWYALRTEGLAYDQTLTTGRLLVNPILAREHVLRGETDAERGVIDDRCEEWGWCSHAGTFTCGTRGSQSPTVTDRRAVRHHHAGSGWRRGQGLVSEPPGPQPGAGLAQLRA